MSGQPHSEKSELALVEEQMLELWRTEGTFEASLKNREGQPQYSFYDGPPFANGLPHFGHSLVTSIKDSMLRYKTMRGYYVPRRNGWDCHGLPVEFAIEKDFGVSGKKQILELGLEKFNAACRDSIFTYKDEWEHLLRRLGRWSDYENYYATVDNSYTESVWWTLGQINQKGLLYKGYKSTPYCPRCETPLSNFEVNDGYKDDISDPSLYVTFKLVEEDASLLGWTTTPWSLPGNAAIAVNPNAQYVYIELTAVDLVENQEKVLVLAKDRLVALGHDDYRVVKEVKGTELVGKKYQPLFRNQGLDSIEGSENLYQVWAADFVSIEDGSGVLHVAPAFGEDDLSLGLEQNIPVLQTVDASGKLKPGIGLDETAGMFFKKADQYIVEHLAEQGSVYLAETFKHTYPFCWRCETPLMYYAISSWFIQVSEIRPQLLKTAREINWTPGHIKDGRFGKWLEGARDWAISRNRYWGAPMPIWVNEQDENDYIVVESYDQLRELVGDSSLDLSDVHRPYIDTITFMKDDKTYRRIEEVLDCWFESGSMSVAQQHYPFENRDKFDQTFPADFIIEGLDQTRLWFYVQHVVATILFEAPAYKNVIVNGMIMAADGQKLSKRLKNYPPVEDVFDKEGADSLRLYLLSSNQATETADYMRFNRDGMRDINRNVLGTLQNSYKFFKMYADLDNWQPPSKLIRPDSGNLLDTWLLARLDEAIQAATECADDYRIAHAIEPIFVLMNDLSNWYIRRSRRRFWKSEDDNDKQAAYATLHFALARTCQLLAPWAPFLSDHIWRGLCEGTDEPVSVHLTDWPQASVAQTSIIEQMTAVRDVINQGLALRAEAKLKVRQPLASVGLPKSFQIPAELHGIIQDELNVKVVLDSKSDGVELDTQLSNELRQEGLARDIVRSIQSARKEAGLNVEDRITLCLVSEDAFTAAAIHSFQETIMAEVLATELSTVHTVFDFQKVIPVEGHDLTIGISKISR